MKFATKFHVTLLLLLASEGFAQSPQQAPPPYHPTVANCPNQVDSAAPIERPVAAPPATDRINFTCQKCKKREPEVAATVAELTKIEASGCFKNFLIAQDPLDEPHGNTNAQIADDLSKIAVHVTFKFHFGFGSACGGLDSGGTHIVDTKNACWDWYGPELRAGYIGHELSHEIGYTHYCTTKDWNDRAGNEMTVPYAAEAAIKACYAEVIKGAPPQPPFKIERTPSTDGKAEQQAAKADPQHN